MVHFSSHLSARTSSCSPLHFLYNRTYHVDIHISLPTPDVILIRPCSPSCHMILIISCTTGVIMWTYTCPYPLLMWSLPGPVVSHAIGFLSFPVQQESSCGHAHVLTLILAKPCSPPCHMFLIISCTTGLVKCICTSLPTPDVGPVVLHAWKFCQIAIDLLTCMHMIKL